MKNFSIYPSGDNALTINFGSAINIDINTRVHQLYHSLMENKNPWWLDVIPAYTSLTIIYNVVQLRDRHAKVFEWCKNQVVEVIESCDWNKELPVRKLRIPVCYDESFALDGKSLCTQKKIKFEKAIELHTASVYRVYMIGFLPGFPYMGMVNKKITVPRLAKPRPVVPSGSVGIAGQQTGIYPLDSPGGWNIIGRTPVKLFNPASPTAPVLVQPCDEVTFYSISKDEFKAFDQSTLEFA